jgi:glycosyltransferase involved in cell wall biosynthesis
MKPFFSIIIPTLNEEDLLPRLLEDIKKQKENDYEVIVVDGSSVDNTKKIALDYKKKYYQLKVNNVSTQRNFGAKKANGRYLVFLDADIRIKKNFLKNIAKNIKEKKGLIFIPYMIPEKGNEEYKPIFDLSNMFVEFSQNLSKKISMGGSMIIESYLFRLIGGFNEKLRMSEDHEIIQRAHDWGVNPKFMKNVHITFCLRRMKKEGQLRLVYKYLLTTAHRLFVGEMNKKIFEYEMGGQAYKDEKYKRKGLDYYIHEIDKLFNKVKKVLKY